MFMRNYNDGPHTQVCADATVSWRARDNATVCLPTKRGVHMDVSYRACKVLEGEVPTEASGKRSPKTKVTLPAVMYTVYSHCSGG